jgi:3-oxoacyl-(acyl-carrier-protein) synthase
LNARIHVAGTGVISAIGHSVADTMASFRQERTGIGRITLFESFYKDTLPVGEVKLSNVELAEKVHGPQSMVHSRGVKALKSLPRTALLAIHAADEAIRQSGLGDLRKWRTGLISGTTVGGMDKTEQFFPGFMGDTDAGHLRDVVNHECGKTAEIMAELFGITGFLSTINTACSSSVNAISYGARLITQGLLDVVVAGGTDALTRFTLNGFNSLMILDGAPCRPFDASRSGLNLGEGAGYVVLVSDRVLQETGARSLSTVVGYANTNDAYHQTASSPEGRGSYAAMEKALQMAGLTTGQIDYINLHGTGTLNNDLSEGTAVKRLFGDAVPRLSSTKAFTGHTLGASGGIEAVFSILAIQNQCVFPNLRFTEAMPELGIVPQTKFESGVRVQHVMSNSFGFGGNCSSIIFSQN